jgi:hypothetical protein
MALLVPDCGELQSLRYLVNSDHKIPRNLILKLYSSDTTPAEGDVPSQTKYYEPYDASGSIGYGTDSSNGYPTAINNRFDQDYSRQYGILLNGNLWNVRTITTPIITTTGSGNVNEYTITVSSTTNIAVGHYVSGGGVGSRATVAAIDGNTIVLTVPNTGTFLNQNIEFGLGTTTASYPEQTFTFSSAANNQYGYYLVRANNLPVDIHGVDDAISVSEAVSVGKTQSTGTIGQNYVTLFDKKYSPTGAGTTGQFTVVVDNPTGITTSQRVVGGGIAPDARVVGVAGTNVVVLDKGNTTTVAGIVTFTVNVGENLCVGMAVTHGNLPGEVNAISADTLVTGYDEILRRVYLSSNLVNNIQAATGDTVYFNFSEVTATNHGLVAGDVIYIAAGTGNTTTESSTYTVFETADTNTFSTTPALSVGAGGSATIYSSIMFAERFTNGPYNIQNNGDQIKVTLNISLD